MRAEHFNELTPAEAEALALLAEECGEVVQVIGKILRHGLYSCHPSDDEETPNRDLLSKELGDVLAAIDICGQENCIVPGDMLERRFEKLKKVKRYLHHVVVSDPTALQGSEK